MEDAPWYLLVNREVSFEERGQGHGEGLDVEVAKASGLDAGRILERAYAR